MEHGLPNFMTDFCVVPADSLDIFLVEDDVAWSRTKVEHALLGRGHTLENPKNQTAAPSAYLACRPMRFSAGIWNVLNEYRKVVHPFSEFHWERVQHFFH